MLLALLLVAFSVIQTPPGAGAKDSDQKELERLEAEWNAAHVRGDVSALEHMFADDVVVVVPGMRVMTKADSLGMFTSGRMKFKRYETSETAIRTYGDTAIVTGRLRRARVVAGASAEDDWRFTKVVPAWRPVCRQGPHLAGMDDDRGNEPAPRGTGFHPRDLRRRLLDDLRLKCDEGLLELALRDQRFHSGCDGEVVVNGIVQGRFVQHQLADAVGQKRSLQSRDAPVGVPARRRPVRVANSRPQPPLRLPLKGCIPASHRSHHGRACPSHRR